jgi:hypothetical protein
MMFAGATNFYRKSGVAERRDLRFPPGRNNLLKGLQKNSMLRRRLCFWF